jgi:hypothetical protein
MCLVIFAWMVSQEYFKDVSNIDIRKRILEENEKKLEEEMTPFGLYDDGMPGDNTGYISSDEFEKFLLN